MTNYSTQLPAPLMTSLSDSEARFAEHMAVFDSPVDAYQHCGAARSSTKRISLQRSAYRMLAHPHVRAAITARRNALAEAGPQATRAALIQDLHDAVNVDVREIFAVTVDHCPTCYTSTAYAAGWALIAARALDHGDPMPPRPMAAGAFDPDRSPEPTCLACRGAGMPTVRYTPTDQLSPAARRLLRGVETNAAGGIKKLVLADVTAMRMELNKTVAGFHAPTTSINLNINTPKPLSRALSVEEALRVMETLGPSAPVAQLVADNTDSSIVSSQ